MADTLEHPLQISENSLFELRRILLPSHWDRDAWRPALNKIYSILENSHEAAVNFIVIQNALVNVYSLASLPRDNDLIHRFLTASHKLPTDSLSRREFIELVEILVKHKVQRAHVRKLNQAKHKIVNIFSIGAFVGLMVCLVLYLRDRDSSPTLLYAIIGLGCTCAIGIGQLLLIPIYSTLRERSERERQVSSVIAALAGDHEVQVHDKSHEHETAIKGCAEVSVDCGQTKSALLRYCDEGAGHKITRIPGSGRRSISPGALRIT